MLIWSSRARPGDAERFPLLGSKADAASRSWAGADGDGGSDVGGGVPGSFFRCLLFLPFVTADVAFGRGVCRQLRATAPTRGGESKRCMFGGGDWQEGEGFVAWGVTTAGGELWGPGRGGVASSQLAPVHVVRCTSRKHSPRLLLCVLFVG